MKKEKKHKNLHNALFIKTYSNLKYCLDLFRLALNSEEYGLFDWENIDSQATVFFDSEWKEKIADLVFTVPMKGTGESADMVFLLEHKSYQDSRLLQQLLNYQNRIYSQKKNPIIPILIYHGREPDWGGSLEFQDTLGGMTEDIRRLFGKEILNFKLRLLNLHRLDSLKSPDLVTNPILFALANIWNLKETELENLFKFYRDTEEGRKEATDMAINYVNQFDNKTYSLERLANLAARTYPEGGKRLVEKLKEPFEHGLEEGIKEGIKEGKRERDKEIALQMIEAGADIRMICRCTGLSEGEVEELKRQSRQD